MPVLITSIPLFDKEFSNAKVFHQSLPSLAIQISEMPSLIHFTDIALAILQTTSSLI